MSSATSTNAFNIFLGAGLALALGAIVLLRGQDTASVAVVALTLLAAGLGWSVALLAGYLAALRRARVRWVLEIEQRLRTLGLGR